MFENEVLVGLDQKIAPCSYCGEPILSIPVETRFCYSNPGSFIVSFCCSDCVVKFDLARIKAIMSKNPAKMKKIVSDFQKEDSQ